MAFSEKIKLTIDVVTGNASSQLSKLRTDLSNAEGGFAKMQVAGASAGNFLKQNMGMAVAAAGTAIAAFGIRAVEDFQAVALGAGSLRDSLGITADEASRFQEVAGDMGISVQALESGIGRMNRAVADTPEAFDNIGAAIARSADGTVDVTETFKNAAEALKRIPNATDRAAAAQAIFGRGWQQMSELIMEGSEGITQAMAGVEAGKIVGDDQINDARKFRDAIDALKGNLEELTVTVGGHLVPALADAAETIQDVKTAAGQLGDALPELPGWLQDVRDKVDDFPLLPHQQITAGVGMVTDGVDDLRDALGAAVTGSFELTDEMRNVLPDSDAATRSYIAQGEAAQETGGRFDELAAAYVDASGMLQEHSGVAEEAEEAIDALGRTAEITAGQVDNLTDEWAELTGEFDDNDAFRNAEESFATLHESALTAWDANAEAVRLAGEAANAAASGADNAAAAQLEAEQAARDAASATRDHEAAVENVTRQVAEYAQQVGGIPTSMVSQIRAALDRGSVDEAERLLRSLERNRQMVLSIVTRGGELPGFAAVGRNNTNRRAVGGPVEAGVPYTVNEHSPGGSEVFVPKVPGQVLSRASAERSYREGVAMANGGGGGLSSSDVAAIAAAVERGAERGAYRAGMESGKQIATALRAGSRF